MKTIKMFVSDMLREFKIQKRKNPDKRDPEPENQSTLLTQKTQKDETETDESGGDLGMDHPSSGQAAGIAEERQKRGESRRTEDSGDGECHGGNIETRREEPEGGRESLDFDKAVKEAYDRGFLDGKNAQIEERYFPVNGDGVPAFRGCPSPASPASTIFSMAREA